MRQRRTDIPTRPVIFHREEGFYGIMIYADNTPAEIAEHANLNPGTLKVTDALSGELLWSRPQ